MKELASHTYTFAEYELDLARRQLLREGQSIPLNAKAFDLVVVLIENRGRVIAREELMELVWRDQFVEEANRRIRIRGSGGKRWLKRSRNWSKALKRCKFFSSHGRTTART